ncbi:unnamed protein product [Vitrella brassicaformis CCMP3155]|uniref:Uncharacterized protein n=2 Tax=Vitrella brassicaformis TaxID=1169539 RepID=A0A0G4FBZ2_VITBC|nr:unnamed protein product [Vitrella brassicaformis CCMP3155]|mmetsp:Transcript_12919/g.37464  ORF Transcript_12919/g.37464 Transcript_12919/m.37464 type:complete len:367 (+) Transcript_12919:51-1151(+)|eukprot:CEM10770.1 unnamed protein product [Vitrella brassicaformis CCMP3155]
MEFHSHRLHRWDDARERRLAAFRREFGLRIQQIAMDLRMEQPSISTALLFFQRFYTLREPSELDAWRILPPCLFLAAKVCEDGKKLREIINCCEHFRTDGKGKTLQMEEYWKSRDEALHLEQMVIRTLSFDLDMTKAYTLLLNLAVMLGRIDGSSGLSTTGSHSLIPSLAWTLINDLFCSSLFVHYPPDLVCLAAVIVTKRLAQTEEFGRVLATRSEDRPCEGLAIDDQHIWEAIRLLAQNGVDVTRRTSIAQEGKQGPSARAMGGTEGAGSSPKRRRVEGRKVGEGQDRGEGDAPAAAAGADEMAVDAVGQRREEEISEPIATLRELCGRVIEFYLDAYGSGDSAAGAGEGETQTGCTVRQEKMA